MTTLILCGKTNSATPEFLDAERVLLEETIVGMNWNAEHVHTVRFTEFPDATDKEKVAAISKELLGTFGIDTTEFQTEFLAAGGYTFLAIFTTADKPLTLAVEPIAAPKAKPPIFHFPWKIPAISMGGILLLVLLYYGTGFILTRSVNAKYTERECQSVIKLAGFVGKVYPLKIASFTEPTFKQSKECQAYLEAGTFHEQKNWEKSYQSYVEYAKAYPKGIYLKESKEQAADSLLAWASEQRGKQDYSSAISNLNLLLNEFGNTSSAPRAKEEFPQVYLEWGDKLHGDGDFSQSETVYLALNEWAKTEGAESYSIDARAGLAHNYFDWGKALHSQKDFEDAASKFEDAISIDPNASDPASAAAMTRAYLPDFQLSWGEHLLSLLYYEEAVKHFEISLRLSNANNVDELKNKLSQVYLDWASSLQGGGDFYQALDKIDLAKEKAATDDARNKAVAAREKTISQFSRSISAQAQNLISSVTQSACANTPINDPLRVVGTQEEKRVVLSGLSLSLPNTVLAMSPGSLRYVACGEETTVKVQSCPYTIIGGYGGGTTYWIERVRYDWVFKVYYASTGKLFQQKTIQGTSPEGCPYTHSFTIGNTTHYHYGNQPVLDTVLKWFASLVK